MKNKWKFLVAHICLTVICVVAVGLAVFLPNKTKASEFYQFSSLETQIAVSAEETGASTANSSEKGGSIYVTTGSTFNFEGGIIQGHNKKFGGAVYVTENSKFKMTGGTISNNTAKFGGAIYVAKGGTCEILGGEISQNFADSGAAIYVEEGGKLTISQEALIENNIEITGDYVINYYIDGLITATTEVENSEELVFNLEDAPYTYENSCGFYLDEDMTYAIEDQQQIISSTSEVKTFNATQDPTKAYFDANGVLNLYTKIATNSKFNFTMSGDTYMVSGNDSCFGDICVPRTHNGLPVELYGSAFQGKEIQDVVLPITVTEIPGAAFMDSYITDINIPVSVTKIWYYAFSGTTGLSEITLTDSINYIGDFAFYDTGITELIVPSKVETINNRFFYNATSAVDIVLEGAKTLNTGAICDGLNINSLSLPSTLTEIKTGAFGNFASSTVRHLVIPEGVTKIEEGAFNNASSLSQITLPSSLGTFNSNIFVNCSTLTDIVLSDGITKMILSDNYKDYEDKITAPEDIKVTFEGIKIEENQTELTLPENTDKLVANMFENCSSLTTINLPDSITVIEPDSFVGLSNITSLTIPNGVTELNDGVFNGLTNLTSLYIPNSVQALGENIFYGLTNLTTLTVPGIETIEASWFGTTEGFNASADNPTCTKTYYTTSLQTLTILEGAKKIGDCAFDSHPTLTTVNLPHSLEVIGKLAFNYRVWDNYGSALRNINLQDTSLKRIEANGIRCSGITSVSFPETLEYIGSRAFQNTKLTGTLVIPENVSTIETLAFEVVKITELVILGNTDIGNAAFRISTLTKAFVSKDANVMYATLFNTGASVINLNVYSSAEMNMWKDNWTGIVNSVTYGCSYDSYLKLSTDWDASGNYIGETTRDELVIPYGKNLKTTDIVNVKRLVLPSSVTEIKGKILGLEELIVNSSGQSILLNSNFGITMFNGSYSISNGFIDASLRRTVVQTTSDYASLITARPFVAKGSYVYDWVIETPRTGFYVLTREFGDGTEDNPYLLSTVENYNSIINAVSNYQSSVYYDALNNVLPNETGATKQVVDYGSIIAELEFDGTYWVIKDFTLNRKYVKLINDIDFSNAEQISIGANASIDFDGNNFGLLNIDSETLGSSLISHGYDVVYKNLNISASNKVFSIFDEILGGTNIFENVNIVANSNGSDVVVDQNGKSMYVNIVRLGSLTFDGCKNYANYNATAEYFGIYVGSHALSNVDVSFINCVNSGNIVTTGVASIFFGNGNYVPSSFELVNCVNNGNIVDGGVEGKESHILATKLSENSAFFTGEYAGIVETYDANVSGQINQNGTISSQEN